MITICWNNLEGLKRTIRSVQQQSRLPDQMWIIDGASNDGTIDWLASQIPAFARSVSEPDDGIYDALNRGLRRCDTDLILFTNSGDELASTDTLELIERDYRENDWGWAYGDVRVVSPDGSTLGRHDLRYLRRARFVGGFGSVPHQGVVMTRRLLDQIGEFRLDLGASADQEHLLRAWLKCEPAYLARDIALFDSTGVSAELKGGQFASQMRSHRRQNGATILQSNVIDLMVTAAAATFDRARRRARGLVSRSRLKGGAAR